MESQTLEQQTKCQHDDFEIFVYRARQNKVIENNIYEKIRKAVDSAVTTVENGMHDANLTAMDNVVFPRVEMAVRSITFSSRHGSNRGQNYGKILKK